MFFSGVRRLVSKMSTNNGSSGPSRRSKRRVSDANQQEEGVINTPRKVMKVVGDDEMAKVSACVKKHRSSVITMDAKLDMLLSQAKLRHEHHVKQKLLSPGRKSSKTEAADRVAACLLRKKETVWGKHGAIVSMESRQKSQTQPGTTAGSQLVFLEHLELSPWSRDS
mmetsp:Transcript_19984/g.27761  ORF Transcript_19984/g.27761 Transcript_19984/m.27761 type:complete len:167 (+) Transcript_19984:165-665(+)